MEMDAKEKAMNYFDGLQFFYHGITRKNTRIQRNYPRFHGIQYLLSGEIFLRLNHGPSLRVTGGHAWLTYPEGYFEYGSIDGKPYDNLFLCFEGPRVQRFIESGLFVKNPEKPLIQINNTEKFFKTMMDAINSLDAPNAGSSRPVLLTEDLLLQLHEQNIPSQQIPRHQVDFFEKLTAAICLTPEKRWDFDLEARNGNMSPLHFRKLFKQYISMPPQQFVIMSRLQRAAALLLTTDEQVSEIGSQVGIENEFYFSRLFRKKYGVSPADYRRTVYKKQ